jgi:hypothetical protein
MNTTGELAPPAARPFLARAFGEDGLNSLATWLALVAVLVASRILAYTLFTSAFNDLQQAAYFAWPALALISVLGVVGVYFAHLSGFPAAFSTAHLSER